MASFAKLGICNVVETVVVVSNDIATTEQAGIGFLNNLYKDDNDIWVQTSYNTFGIVHKLGGTPFRKNYAGIGYVYNPVLDAFIPPKPHPSWTLNESTGLWDSPIPYPDDGKVYIWKESDMKWELKEE